MYQKFQHRLVVKYKRGLCVHRVVSVETPEKGYFELALNNIENSNGVYYITSVKGPKGTKYKLLYPTRNDKLQYMPNSSLTIIMQSNKELDEYASFVKEKALKEAKIKFESEKRKLKEYLADVYAISEKNIFIS